MLYASPTRLTRAGRSILAFEDRDSTFKSKRFEAWVRAFLLPSGSDRRRGRFLSP